MNDTATISEINYSEEQLTAINKAVDWLASYEHDDTLDYFVLTGYAGTGKTTCIREIIQRAGIDSVRFAAYTGKAARVIQKVSGYKTSTIHSLIYSYIPPDREACSAIHNQLHGEEPEEDNTKRQLLQQQLDELQKPRFEINEESDLNYVDLLILDECSMVNSEILEDLLSFNKPIIALGDPGQLPPIEGTGALFTRPADAHLEQIHRQAKGNPIIAASFKARKGIPWGSGTVQNDQGSFSSVDWITTREAQRNSVLLKAEQILCGKHKTRIAMNVQMRKLLGFDFTNPYPQVGEKLVCKRNDKDYGLYNGDIMVVTKVGELYDTFIELWVRPEDEGEDKVIKVQALRAYFDEYFTPESLKRVQWWDRKNTQEFDFGYVITIHTSQGSQWNKLCVIDDGLFRGWQSKSTERKQLLYTAITRAAEALVIFYKR